MTRHFSQAIPQIVSLRFQFLYISDKHSKSDFVMKELDEIQTLSNGDVTFGLDFEGFGQNK
jgi:hypothetical protein